MGRKARRYRQFFYQSRWQTFRSSGWCQVAAAQCCWRCALRQLHLWTAHQVWKEKENASERCQGVKIFKAGLRKMRPRPLAPVDHSAPLPFILSWCPPLWFSLQSKKTRSNAIRMHDKCPSCSQAPWSTLVQFGASQEKRTCSNLIETQAVLKTNN